jgi:hypothetical protein
MTTSTLLPVAAMMAAGLTIGFAADGTGSGTKGGSDRTDGSGSATSLYDFTIKNIDGDDVHLAKYKGLVCLVVNVASR